MLEQAIAEERAAEVLDLVDSFDGRLAFAQTHTDLFLRAAQVQPALLEIDEILGPFGADVLVQASENLTANIAYVDAEMDRLGVRDPASPTPELSSPPGMSERGATADVQALAAQVSRALEAQEQLRRITVGYESDQTRSGTEGGAGEPAEITFDHDQPPSSITGAYPGAPPVTPWIDVDRHWLVLEEAIAAALASSPALFAILRDRGPVEQREAAGELAQDDPENATERVRAALHELSGDLQRAGDRLDSLDWRDLLPVQQLVAGSPQWQAPLERAVVAGAVSRARAGSPGTLKTILGAAGLVVALTSLFATSGMAASLLAMTGTGISGATAAASWLEYDRLATLHKARTGHREHDLVEGGQVDAVLLQAILESVFLFVGLALLPGGTQARPRAARRPARGSRRRPRRRAVRGGARHRADRRGERPQRGRARRDRRQGHAARPQAHEGAGGRAAASERHGAAAG